jgi:DUF1680 family protein
MHGKLRTVAILSLGATLVAALVVAFETTFPGLNLLLETHGYSGGAPGVAKQESQPAAVVPLSDQSVINLNHSPYARLKGVPVRAVTIQDGFWAKRRKVVFERSIPSIRQLLEEHGYIDNFRRLAKHKDVPRKGPVYTDSDLYKWIESVAYALESGADPQLRAVADQYVDLIVSIQEPNGYLNTYWQGDKASQRLTPEAMDWGHELYCLGHMSQAAVAYYRATGNRKLLDAAVKYADFLVKNYGPHKRPLLAGHPEISMGLIELYRTTGDRRFLNLAGYILNGDPRIHRDPSRVIYTFSGIPFKTRTHLEGHAVRAMYACSGATDYYLETGDPQYLRTLQTLWNDLVTTKMYVTGGLGARWSGEAIGAAYELPNARAYAETCAAVGSYMWNWRMLAATGDARYSDLMERTLYNAINVGMSLSGTLYCYYNPMEFAGKASPNGHSPEGRVRNPWYNTLCCPPNIERTLGSLPGYFYSTSQDGIYVNLFDNSVLRWHLGDGTGLKITQKTNYPWEGTVDFTIDPAAAKEFTFYLRIPGWSRETKVIVNGTPVESGMRPGSYLPIRRTWKAGDQVRLQLNMAPQLLVANPHVEQDTGRVAVLRGPLVYTLEQIDQPGVQRLANVSLAIGKEPGSGFKAEFRPNLLGGVEVLQHPGMESERSLATIPLYQPISQRVQPPRKQVNLTFIPYYAWANRAPSAMRVWVPFTRD